MDTYVDEVVKRASELINQAFVMVPLGSRVGPGDAGLIVQNAFEIAKHEVSKARYTREYLLPKDFPPASKPKNFQDSNGNEHDKT